MKSVLLAVCSAFLLSACADDYYGYNDYGYGYPGYRSRGYGYSGYGYGYPGYGYSGSSVYYDGYYGPYYGGYWGGDGYYYYRSGPGRPYSRDNYRHFRRDSADGYRRYGDRRYDRDRGHDRDHDWDRDHDRR